MQWETPITVLRSDPVLVGIVQHLRDTLHVPTSLTIGEIMHRVEP
jgi:hypothetical protein